MRAVLSMAFLFFGTVAQADGPVTVDPAAPPARLISEYNLFKDASRQIPNDGLVPYDLNTPLFSDYTAKHRFVYVSDGLSAEYRDKEHFLFPAGSVLVKTFSYLNDMRDPAQGERIIETRLLIKTDDNQWIGLPYLWKDDMSEATLAVAGATVDVEWIHSDGEPRQLNYIVPNMNQCKQCHENKKQLMPIGPKAQHLNKDFRYAHGVENQLARWASLGILTGLPENLDKAPRVPNAEDPASGPLDARARAWLDINCAHCHNPDGPAFTSGLDLSFGQTDPAMFGVNKPPVAAGRGSGNLLFGIAPGDPEASILHFRVASTEPGVMMPPLPRRVVDEEGLALLREWISAMAK
jgi:uncharacterized repeat protein (TIGR03806 family)